MNVVEWVTGCAQTVFNEMGSGHSENVYESCMVLELGFITPWGGWCDEPIIASQVPCPLKYKTFTVGTGFIDILIHNYLVIELKTVAKLTPKDVQQVRKYLIALDLDLGLLINFGNDLEIIEVQKAGNHGETYSETNRD